jgi:hypothetical protein
MGLLQPNPHRRVAFVITQLAPRIIQTQIKCARLGGDVGVV